MNRKIGLIIAALSFILIAVIAYYFLYYSKEKTNKAAVNIPITETENKIEKKDNTGKVENTSRISAPVNSEKANAPIGQVDLERMAKSFAERFGSFSNQSNYENITDLKMFMSEKMKKWADAYLAENKKQNAANQVYYGLTTKALSAQTKTFDNEKGQAVIIVETRRREAMGTTNNSSKLYNQNLTISFVKEKGAWKADSAIWEQ